MEVIQSNPELDVNSNVFKDGGYWTPPHRGERDGSSSTSSSVSSHLDWDLYDLESPEMAATVRAVSLRLEQSLRAAKKAHLSCGEVLLPSDLLSRVARDIIRMAETEPCGLRGCLILLNFESGQSSTSSGSQVTSKDVLHASNSSLNSTSSSGSSDKASVSSLGSSGGMSRNIGKIRCDSQTVTTFELHLTLREDPTPWYSRLPQILRNLTKGGAIVVSPAYVIAKKKLYRSH